MTWAAARRWGMVGLIGGSGVLHLVSPDGYRRIVPHALGHEDAVVLASGLAEIGCALLMAIPRTRRWGGLLTAALLVAVFPANVQMALDGGLRGAPFPLGSPAAAWLRLPLQIPLVVWAIQVGLHGDGRAAARRAA